MLPASPHPLPPAPRATPLLVPAQLVRVACAQAQLTWLGNVCPSSCLTAQDNWMQGTQLPSSSPHHGMRAQALPDGRRPDVRSARCWRLPWQQCPGCLLWACHLAPHTDPVISSPPWPLSCNAWCVPDEAEEGLDPPPARGHGHKRSRSRLEEVASDERTLFGNPREAPTKAAPKPKAGERTMYSHCR